MERKLTDPQSLILSADENRADDVPNNETCQEDIVQFVMAKGIEDGEADQPDSANDGREDGEES